MQNAKISSIKEQMQVFSIKEQMQVFSIKEQMQVFSIKEQMHVFSIKEQMQVFSIKKEQSFTHTRRTRLLENSIHMEGMGFQYYKQTLTRNSRFHTSD